MVPARIFVLVAAWAVVPAHAGPGGSPPPTAEDPPAQKLIAPAPMQAAVVAVPGDRDLPGCQADWSNQIVSMNGYRRTPMVSAWLRNGVRVHHLQRETMPGLVFITISFCGGEMLETAANRGVTLGACSAWDELSVTNLPAACVPSALEGRDVHLEALAGPDAMQLRVWGRREDIDEGMRVAAAMFEHAKVTSATLATTMADGRQQIETRAATPGGMVADAIADVIFPAGEARARPASAAQLDAVAVDAAQAWLERHIAEAPVEASIVGDLTLDEAMRLAAGYLGRLPQRPRVSPDILAGFRQMNPPIYPIRSEVLRPIEAGSSIVVVGFPGADGPSIPELRTMRVAARVFDERATAAMRAAGFADAEVGSAAIPGTVYPGFGVVVVNVKVPAARALEAAEVLEGVVRQLAEAGVNDAEVQPASADLVRAVERFEREPRYWEVILARADATGVDPDQVAEGVTFYRSVNADTVSAAIRRNVGGGRIFRLIIKSDGSGRPASPSPMPQKATK